MNEYIPGLWHGDCVEVMATFEPDSVDAIVTDPPYGLEFMGKDWDKLDTANYGSVAEGNGSPHSRRHSVNYTGAPNPTCRRCGGLRSLVTEGSGGRHRCQCEHPDFPDYRGPAMRAMQDWHERWAREAFRIAKPGAYLLAFGGTRTAHRLATAIEDAGWEIRDTLMWVHLQGFPKSLDVSKAIDKAAGLTRTLRVNERWAERYPNGPGGNLSGGDHAATIHQLQRHAEGPLLTSDAVSPEAEKWNGWGTALKPAYEPIVMARKPLRGTVAANVQAYGTGALNIDGTRIGVKGPRGIPASVSRASGGVALMGSVDGSLHRQTGNEPGFDPAIGRWPANVILTDDVFGGGVEGVIGGGGSSPGMMGRHGIFGADVAYLTGETYGDSGSKSRIFIIPKASRRERERGLRGMTTSLGKIGNHGNLSAGDDLSAKLGSNQPRANTHPTVKPLMLMRHLVRLVTPPGGLVLDPFLGSGTTAMAAVEEGFRWVGIESDAEYLPIAAGRIASVAPHLGLPVPPPLPRLGFKASDPPGTRIPRRKPVVASEPLWEDGGG